MMYRRMIAVALAVACAMAVASTVEARPRHTRALPAQQTETCNDRGCAVQASAGERVAKARGAASAGISFGGGDLVSEARRYIGGNPTGRKSLWCGAFMDLVLRRTGHAGGGNLARNYASYGTRVSGPCVGCIAVMARKGGGHVGIVSAVDGDGNPIIISGNHGRRVAESKYARARVYAYVRP